MALGDPYSDLTTLKARLNISNTTDDARLTNALAAATNEINGYCDRQFNDAGSASARVYYPQDVYVALVDDFSTTTGLIVQADYSNTGTYGITWTSAQYQCEPLNGIVSGEPGWPFHKLRAVGSNWMPVWIGTFGIAPRAALQITARWGWAAVPGAVSEACLMLAEETFKMKDAPFGVAGFGQFGAIRVRDNPKVEALLKRYRRYSALVG